MRPLEATCAIDRSTAYRREARRLRSRIVASPVRLQRSLRALASRSDVARATPEDSILIDSIPRGGVREFANRVAGRIDSPILRYSERLQLLREAGRLRIGRFEANLIIAAAEHHRRQPPTEDLNEIDFPIQNCPALLMSLIAFIAQLLLAAALWHLL